MKPILRNKTIAFLKLIRIENLVMIAVTQVLMRYCIIHKILSQNLIDPGIHDGLFFMVVLSTLLIAAAGYVINDYFDLKTDLINHPDTVVVDTVIKRRMAIILHITFTMLGLFIGMYAALKTGYLRLAIFHFVAAILLWFYSTDLKKMLLVGNVVVSLLTAAVPFLPFVFEMGVLQNTNPGFISDYRHAVFTCFRVISIYALFAFIISMAREIVKDIEDYKGDKATGGLTMPIVWGIRASKINAFFLLVISAILLSFVVYNSVRVSRIVLSPNNVYILLALIVPIAVLAVYSILANRNQHFKSVSVALKLIMLMGLGYSFIFYYN